MVAKRMSEIRKAIQPGMVMGAVEAFEKLKELSKVKFAESVDVSINLGIDPKKSDQVVRGACALPKGTGREVRAAVLTRDVNAEVAKKAGADIVGYDDLADSIKAGNYDFDVLIATPDAMPIVGKLGPLLGPRGLMPNPKLGTVTPDVASAVKNVKAGQARFRADKAGIVHSRIGGVQFSAEDLLKNLESLIVALKKAKPSSSKGIYIKKITVSTTMGPGIVVDQSTLQAG